MEPTDNTTTGAAGNKKPAGRITGMFMANPEVSCRVEERDGAILFNPDTDNTTLINPSGLVTWKFLRQPHTLEEAAANLAEAFSGSPDRATVIRDLDAFLSELIPEYIIEVDSSGDPASSR